MVFSRRAQQIKPSATLAITAQAKQMQSQGIDVIGFGAGEPDFPTPAHAVEAAVEAVRGGDTRYTPVGGTAELRTAICRSIERDYGFSYTPAEVTVSCGAKHSLFNLFLALVDEGDEVIIPSPYWLSYPEQVQFAGATPVFVETREEDGFRLRAETLEAALSARTKAIIVNSPSNPTGGMYRADDLRDVAELVRGRDIFVISDDIYHRLTYDGAAFANILHVAPELRPQTVLINGVSKTYAMTGWRIGYAAGPRELIRVMEDIQSQSTSNPTSFAQKGAVSALLGPQDALQEMVQAFAERRRLLVDALNAIPGVHCLLPEGAFYAFPNVSRLYGKKTPTGELRDSLSLTAYLLEEAKVAVIPGGPFGSEDHIRLSYATSSELLREGVRRIAEAVARLSRP
jgi:aspartate aminotransferase